MLLRFNLYLSVQEAEGDNVVLRRRIVQNKFNQLTCILLINEVQVTPVYHRDEVLIDHMFCKANSKTSSIAFKLLMLMFRASTPVLKNARSPGIRRPILCKKSCVFTRCEGTRVKIFIYEIKSR